jgi:hypothetical protein
MARLPSMWREVVATMRSVTCSTRSRLSRYRRAPTGAWVRGNSISPNKVRKVTESTNVTTPNAEILTLARPPETLAAPPAMAPAWSLRVSSEWLPPLMNRPRSLWRASLTNRGRLSLKARTPSMRGWIRISNATPVEDDEPR